MHASRRFIAIPILLVVVASVAGALYLVQQTGGNENGPLRASGTVEAVEVIVSSELGGQLAEVLVQEGETVKAGDPLFRLDDELLQVQRRQALAALENARAGNASAQAGLELAQANLDIARASLDAADASAQAELEAAQQALDELYKNADLARAEALAAVAAAVNTLRDANYQLDNFTVPSNQSKMTALEAIEVMGTALDRARARFEPYKYTASTNATRQDLKEALDEAQADYDAAVRRLELEAAVEQSSARLQKAQADLKAVENGPDPDEVARLEKRIAALQASVGPARASVEQANASLAQAQARLDQSLAMLLQAQSELDLIEVQLNKLTAYAPVAGVVLARNIEPGEVIQPGASAIVLGQLDHLTITVYIPEDRYGRIRLGMPASVKVDSFPAKAFEAHVVRIADQAEFTPRNVQTEEGRRTTVFAVELEVDDPQSALRPGMPADVEFSG